MPKKWDKPMLRWKQSCSGWNIRNPISKNYSILHVPTSLENCQFPQPLPGPPKLKFTSSKENLLQRSSSKTSLINIHSGLGWLEPLQTSSIFDPTNPWIKKNSLRLWIPAILIFDFMTPQKIAGRGAIATVEDWRRFFWNGLEINKIFGVWGQYM